MADLRNYKEIHIIGIGGAGMSAIARVLRGWGINVHGSDRRESPLTKALQAEGIPVALGHAAENLGQADLVVASSAVPEDNVEWTAAQARGIEAIYRPEMLGRLTEGYKLIAVAGAHGKTTVTGMVSLMLLEAGLDPTFIIGGVVRNLETNARVGQSEYFVIEADEYRNTFMALHPQIAVITNVEFDHPDCFPSPRFVRLAFGEFADNVRPGGALVVYNDDKVAHAVGASFHANGGKLALYGIRDGIGLAWQARDIHPNDRGGVSFTAVNAAMQAVGEIHLQIPGAYNAANALAALTVGTLLELSWDVMQGALERFAGTGRRFDILGEAGGVTVIDDYAHHPSQIKAVLAAARQRYPGRRIIAAWEPHTYSRIQALEADFLTAFADADHVVVLPIYAAREAPDPAWTAQVLAQRISHPSVAATSDLEHATATLAGEAQPGDVVLLMGAGDEYVVGQQLLETL